ncbi:hypothetical protein [Nocardioides sp. 1609]|uniref:hypothetical protein n=1 Tax=Nocardioides sp. 1609 TaxID=2508327 RepID=UPI001ADACEBF|nr:hypothetical protein [Nocardioides sp. 1609]
MWVRIPLGAPGSPPPHHPLVRNRASQRVAGEVKRYDYPRWQLTNVSADIRELCCWALDLVDVPWRQSRWNCISVSRREAVARLDGLIGPKT